MTFNLGYCAICKSQSQKVVTMLGEKSTKEIAQIHDSQGFEENKIAARLGGDIAGNARRSLESCVFLEFSAQETESDRYRQNLSIT
jgi:hypothetical protein